MTTPVLDFGRLDDIPFLLRPSASAPSIVHADDKDALGCGSNWCRLSLFGRLRCRHAGNTLSAVWRTPIQAGKGQRAHLGTATKPAMTLRFVAGVMPPDQPSAQRGGSAPRLRSLDAT
jgi:hypothetical protein